MLKAKTRRIFAFLQTQRPIFRDDIRSPLTSFHLERLCRLLTYKWLARGGLLDQLGGSLHQHRGCFQMVVEGRHVQRRLPQGSWQCEKEVAWGFFPGVGKRGNSSLGGPPERSLAILGSRVPWADRGGERCRASCSFLTPLVHLPGLALEQLAESRDIVLLGR